jgi:3-deoxy-D-manno-octulosonic-acid transferase
MSYLLNLAYLLVLLAAAPFLVFQSLFRGKYREGFAAKFWGAVPQRDSNRPCIWFHAVSVGEVNLLSVLLNAAHQNRPDVECVISTTTMTGYALAKKKYTNHTVFYCPLDFTWAVRRAMRRIRPSLLVLAELELWPNLIQAAKQHGANAAIANGRLSQRSFKGYRKLKWLLQPTLDRIQLVAAQDQEYAGRFQALGIEPGRVQVTGSLKFDGANSNRENQRTRELRQLAGITNEDIVFLAGSTQAPEEQLALEAFQALHREHPNLRLIIVPRHPHRFDEVAALLDRSGLPWQRRSKLAEVRSEESGNCGRILLVDTVGELGAWWGTATVGFVGGSLYSSRGGQNMIEPAAYGVATCFGPNTQNFRDVVELLLSQQASVRVNTGEELTNFLQRCLENPSEAAKLGTRAAEVVRQQQGATNRTWLLFEELLPKPMASVSASKNRSAA